MKKKKLFELYEIFSLLVGISAIITLIFFMIVNMKDHIVILEPNPYIRYTEIIIGFFVFPYYFNKVLNFIKG